jgi:putative transposase
MRYIEMNPVRAGMVDHPVQYRWSSYAANAFGMTNAIVHQHDEYIGLGASTDLRQKAYQKLFVCDFNSDVLGLLRQSLQSGTPLGNDQFKARVEAAIGKKIGSIGPGRPRKKPAAN